MASGYETFDIHIKGVVPLILHNGRLSDPLDPLTIALADAVKASKKTKTDAAIANTCKAEFMGGLYIGDDGGPCIPGEVLEAAIRSAAKASKEGKSVQSGLFCDGNFPLIYDGPRSPKDLWESKGEGAGDGIMDGRRFVDRRRVRVGQAAVMRTRPIFHKWELIFTVSFDPETLNRKSIIGFVELLGRKVGLCENRPRYGRFEIVS